MLSSIILSLIGLLVAYMVIDGILLLRMSHRRDAKGTPGLFELLRHSNHDLKLVSMGTLNRYAVDNALRIGGKAALEDEIRRQFTKTKIDHWTLDYCLPHLDLLDRAKAGYWAYNRAGEATIFFYERVKKAQPVPPPAPPVQVPNMWTERDEKQRIELFLSNPLAFWLNPDWSDPSQPFWMRDPALIPDSFDPASQIKALARILRQDHKCLRHEAIGMLHTPEKYAVFVYDENYTEIKVDNRTYLKALRLARSNSALTDS